MAEIYVHLDSYLDTTLESLYGLYLFDKAIFFRFLRVLLDTSLDRCKEDTLLSRKKEVLKPCWGS